MSRPIAIEKFNGLWSRGPIEDCPMDHFTDCLNTSYINARVECRSGITTPVAAPTGIVKMLLYKPLPPYTGTNIPRIIALKSNGDLFDVTISPTVPIYSNASMKDFALVNFFGRAYISPSDGKIGLSGVNVQVYSGSGVTRDAAGAAPTTGAIVGTASASGVGKIDRGTYLISYAFETASGFITRPRVPFVGFDSFGDYIYDVTTLPVGPAGTVARWIIITKANELLSLGPLGGPYQVGLAEFLPLFFQQRVGNNTATVATVNFYDESLIEDASYLYNQLTAIPSGVGLLDYKGRLVSYGEAADPSLVRVSQPGEPESISSTSGFIITDPSDSTGVRDVVEFRNVLYMFKRNTGYMAEDNGNEASTWAIIAFEKANGTEHDGISVILDAKGSSSDGFIIASLGALYYFNGVFSEPELSYKIRDLWLRINPIYFHLIQVVTDPVIKKIYIIIPLDSSTVANRMIVGDYRNGLDAKSIKWSLWKFDPEVKTIAAYTDFTSGDPSQITKVGHSSGISDFDLSSHSDAGANVIESYIEFPPVRFSDGMSQYTRARLSVSGLCTLEIIAYGIDKIISYTAAPIVVASLTPGREYAQLLNLVSEQCRLRLRVNTINEYYRLDLLSIEGIPLWDERPR